MAGADVVDIQRLRCVAVAPPAGGEDEPLPIRRPGHVTGLERPGRLGRDRRRAGRARPGHEEPAVRTVHIGQDQPVGDPVEREPLSVRGEGGTVVDDVAVGTAHRAGQVALVEAIGGVRGPDVCAAGGIGIAATGERQQGAIG